MVANPGTAGSAGGVRFLNRPRGIAAEANAAGEPTAIAWRGRMVAVRAILDRWRVDDEWWREEIARRYFAVELAGGRRLTVYQDLVTGEWFLQPYQAARDDDGRQPGGGPSRPGGHRAAGPAPRPQG